MFGLKTQMISQSQALPGRPDPIPTEETHVVLGTPLKGPYPEGSESVVFAMGCFWGVERLFWKQPGVFTTAAGYIGGFTPNPTYKEVCSGQTGHTEGVLVVYDPKVISFQQLLKIFWENHDPTQGHRQGNDVGTQYRSAIIPSTSEQYTLAMTSRDAFATQMKALGKDAITTEVYQPSDTTEADAPTPFYFAEDYHQGYLDKNPGGYCGLKGTGATCVI
ncbi:MULTISPECIES: peptide-methionine (S)-S-oxide reductase MsrA [Asticcacaulis]|uniref:peptide-methionine (S)-S-oxide reductase MsrA n=1 Tax=Asticcacaulis TaxID=76890 RepID=UPI001AEA44FD|nr:MULTISPECIES: peptide-methionine (S)-S-oxide reductase MsrA [Asticcacaulis]MBP2161792.1 peptide-methionine (S)-S-oxide reductase [Asticcacaulis solisilvae]MDR6802838.1 peptide-methionine (S)-S-oxide reductase [Asticcacaulis sp. BE141]